MEQFHRFLAVFPADLEGQDYLELTRQQMDKVSGGSLAVQSQPPAEVFLDGRGWDSARCPWRGCRWGSHRVEVRAHGGSQSKEITVAARSTKRVSFTLLGAAAWRSTASPGRR